MAEPTGLRVVGPPEDAGTPGQREQLVEIANGSHSALAQCYRAHGGRVFALARRILGDDRQAESVVEAVFLSLWDHPERFDAGRGSLAFQLLADGRNRSLELLRSGDGARRRPRRDPVPSDPLAPEERQVIELAFFEGRTSREMAELLQLEEATVLARIRSGLHRLVKGGAP